MDRLSLPDQYKNQIPHQLPFAELDSISEELIIKLYVEYDGVIPIQNIDWFYKTSIKCDNDIVNKIREKIIKSLNDIPEEYLNHEIWGDKWNDIKNKLNDIMKQLYFKETGNEEGGNITYNIVSKGGRGNIYDFEINYSDGVICKLEFKYGKNIFEYAQFLSLYWNGIEMVDKNYIKYWYDNYLVPYLNSLNIDISNMVDFEEYNQNIYKTGCQHQLFSKIREEEHKRNTKTSEYSKITDDSINNFLNLEIDKNNINKQNLQNRMDEQKNKIFLFCRDGEFRLDKISDHMDLDLDKEVEVIHNTIILTTTSNKKIRCNLRWKNGKGCVGPAWQISLRHR